MGKHTTKVTIIILLMFLITQFIGLWIVNYYSQPANPLPFGMEVPEEEQMNTVGDIISIVLAFAIAIGLFFIFRKNKSRLILRGWFFIVVLLSLGIFFVALLNLEPPYIFLALIFALPLALSKVYKRNLISHNLSELMIYPAIAAVFVPFLNLLGAIILLILISLYDAWAVWKSGIMQKMARFQMDEVKVFGGFLIPYLNKKQEAQLKRARKQKNANSLALKVNVAILGGGDVVFPIIVAGVTLLQIGLAAAIAVILGALVGLGALLFLSKKKKFYPAMPFISTGILTFLGISLLIF